MLAPYAAIVSEHSFRAQLVHIDYLANYDATTTTIGRRLTDILGLATMVLQMDEHHN